MEKFYPTPTHSTRVAEKEYILNRIFSIYQYEIQCHIHIELETAL